VRSWFSVRNLSSRTSTFAYATFIPCVVVGVFSVLAFAAAPGSWLGACVFVACSVLMGFARRRVAIVKLDGDALAISRNFRSIRVPLHQVHSIAGSTFLAPDRIWVSFEEPTPFGREIVFFPSPRFVPTSSTHPIASDLSALCSRARSKRTARGPGD
jgi:hypothetical protein